MQARIITIKAFLLISHAQALPINHHFSESHLDPRGHSVYTDATYGTSTEGRLAYGLVSFACLFSVAFVLGTLVMYQTLILADYPQGIRAKRFDRKNIKFTWLLVQLQTLIALGLTISSSILVVTLGTTTQEQCFSAIMVCVAFYTTAKMCL